MTQAYQASRETADGSEVLGAVPYTALVPPGWEGFCVHCRRRLTVADWQAGRIAAAGTGDPWHCICLCHLQEGGREYRRALHALARAVAGV